MNKMFLLNVLLALAWLLLTGVFSPTNLFFGFILGFLVLMLPGNTMPEGKAYIKRARSIGSFLVFFLYELTAANIKVAFDVLTIKHYMRPGIVAIPLDVKGDFEITLFANLITLTPGTLSIDISDDCKVLYVHSMYIDDPETFRQGIKNQLERRLLKVLR